jgi:hypothetical protein
MRFDVSHGDMTLEQGLERGHSGQGAARGEGEQDRNQPYRQDGGQRT